MATKAITTVSQPAVYVYEAPLRVWHWVNGLSIMVLIATGWFIGDPPPTMPGEASDNYLFGYIRFAHFVAAYAFIVGFVFRIYWAFVGNRHARQMFAPPLANKEWWAGVWQRNTIQRRTRCWTCGNDTETILRLCSERKRTP